MTKVDNTDIKKIAKLSRLAFSDDETVKFSSQISDIISWVNKLDEINTEDVVPMIAVEDKLHMRPDNICTENETSEILENCTDTEYGFYAVPKFVD